MLGVNMTRSFGGNPVVDHIYGRDVVLVDRCWAILLAPQLLHDSSKVFGMLCSKPCTAGNSASVLDGTRGNVCAFGSMQAVGGPRTRTNGQTDGRTNG